MTCGTAVIVVGHHEFVTPGTDFLRALLNDNGLLFNRKGLLIFDICRERMFRIIGEIYEQPIYRKEDGCGETDKHGAEQRCRCKGDDPDGAVTKVTITSPRYDLEHRQEQHRKYQ